MDICHLKNAELETKTPKTQWSICIPRRHCERWFWILCSIYRTRIISSISHGYHIQTARIRRTSNWRNIRLYPGNMKDAPKLLEIPKLECPDIWIRLLRHKWPKSWSSMAFIFVKHGRSSRSFWAKSVRSSFDRICMGKVIWENPITAQLGENFQLKILFRTPWKRNVLICVCGWHQILLERKKSIRCGKWSTKKSTWETQYLSLIM